MGWNATNSGYELPVAKFTALSAARAGILSVSCQISQFFIAIDLWNDLAT